jgi:hypothetical protein
MANIEVSVPELAFVAATRAMAGAGIGLVTADLLRRPTRRSVGWALLAVGIVTTLPIALNVLCRTRSKRARRDEPETG